MPHAPADRAIAGQTGHRAPPLHPDDPVEAALLAALRAGIEEAHHCTHSCDTCRCRFDEDAAAGGGHVPSAAQARSGK